jgi:hypothetical protein
MRFVFYTLLLFYCNAAAAQQKIFIDNANPQLTTLGKIVDAHDGRIIQFGKKFYWYGTAYGNTNGFTTANEYVCYSSINLKDWKYEGPLLAKKPTGVYYRPHVVYNKKTNKYILWYNWYPKLWNGQFGVAESNNPHGPFKIINDNVQVKHSSLGVGDLGVFTDDDGKAYLSYNTITGHKVSVELLDETYTASTRQGSEFIAEHCEAGSMFKHNGLYYLLTDYTCCFCTQGSGAKVFTATHPLGKYEYRQNINRHPGQLAAVLQDGFVNDNFFETFTAKEQNAITVNYKTISKINLLTIHQFTGNRNGQCGQVQIPAVHDPILEYEFTLEYFNEGEWKNINAVKKTTQNQSQQIIYNYSFPAVAASQFRITPVYSDTLFTLLIAEISFNTKEKPVVYKTNSAAGKPIIPAQQTYVMQVQTNAGKKLIWMGDLWGSASDNIKGHDYQFWSTPLQFYKNGLMQPLQWVNNYSLKLK